MVQEKQNEKPVTWIHLWGSFGGLLIIIITSWVNMSVKVAALSVSQADQDKSSQQDKSDQDKSNQQILESIKDLRAIQLQEVKEMSELKGQVQAYQTIGASKK